MGEKSQRDYSAMKFSIIIPTYNREHELPRAIESVLKQTYQDWELIIVDDGSTDGTREVTTRYSGNDQRIHLVQHSRNKGVNAAKNTGISHAKGSWISILDSDDEFYPNALDNMHCSIRQYKDNFDIFGFMYDRKEPSSNKINKIGFKHKMKWDQYQPTYQDIVLKKNIGGDIHYIYKNSAFEVDTFPEWIPGFETFLLANLIKKGQRFLFINKVVALVHQDAQNRMSQNRETKWPKIYAKAYKEFIIQHSCAIPKDKKYDFYVIIAKCYARSFNYIKSMIWILKALSYDKERSFKLLRKAVTK